MSRYVAPTSSAPVKTGITNRGSAAFRIASQSFALAQSATCMASVASIDAAENFSPRSYRSTIDRALPSSMSAKTMCS